MAEAKVREGSILAVVVDEATNSIVFNVRGAAPEGGAKSTTLDMAKLHPSIVAYAALHGMKQRIVDMAALSRNPETGKAATPSDKFEALSRGVEHYMSGAAEWNLRQSAGERTDGQLALLARALVELKGGEISARKDWLKTKSSAERLKLSLHPEIKPLIEGYQAEMASSVDADELMKELG